MEDACEVALVEFAEGVLLARAEPLDQDLVGYRASRYEIRTRQRRCGHTVPSPFPRFRGCIIFTMQLHVAGVRSLGTLAGIQPPVEVVASDACTGVKKRHSRTRIVSDAARKRPMGRPCGARTPSGCAPTGSSTLPNARDPSQIGSGARELHVAFQLMKSASRSPVRKRRRPSWRAAGGRRAIRRVRARRARGRPRRSSRRGATAPATISAPAASRAAMRVARSKSRAISSTRARRLFAHGERRRQLAPVGNPGLDPGALNETGLQQRTRRRVPFATSTTIARPSGAGGDPVDDAVFFAEHVLGDQFERRAELARGAARSRGAALVARRWLQSSTAPWASPSSIDATSASARADVAWALASAIGRPVTIDRERCTSSTSRP